MNETGIEKTSLHRYLYLLEELRILEKRVPVTEKLEKSRRGLYFLTDNYFSFYFDMVFPFRSGLALGNKTAALSRFDHAFVHHAASAYEQVGAEMVRELEDDVFPFSRVGKWWGHDGEIDVVAIGESSKDALFAEVKWSAKSVGVNVYENLKGKARLVPGITGLKRYALVSRSGFTASMRRLAKKERVFLIRGERRIQ